MMRGFAAGMLALVAFTALGCNLEAGSSTMSPPPRQGPPRIVGLRAQKGSVAATATDQELSVLIDGVDERGETVYAYGYEPGAATCDLPGCTAVVRGYAVLVRS